MTQSITHDSTFDTVVGILKRRKWVGVVAFAATLSLGVPIALSLPNVYRGVTTVAIDKNDASSFVRATVPELETRIVTIQQELLSRGRLVDLITRLNLYTSLRARVPVSAIVERMRRDIRIELSRADPGRATAIGLKISYVGLDARSAAAVPNALAAQYVEENGRIRERQTGEIADFLKGQLETAQKAVVVQQMRLDRFKQERAGQLPEQISLNMVTLERLNTRLRLNIDDQLKVRELHDRLEETAATTEPADELQVAKQHLAALQVKFTDRHPDVIRAKAEIAEIERQRAAEPQPAARRTGRASGAETALASLQKEEQTLRSEIAAYEQRIQATPRVEQEMEALQRDYSVAKDSYSSILKRFEEAQLAERLEQSKKGESFRILDAAVVPASPAAPNRQRLLLMAVFFAIAAAAGIMLLNEHLDTSFHSVGELRQFTTLPVLATIPYVKTPLTFGTIARTALVVVGVATLCFALAGFGYRAARHNTQLVWMLSAPQL